MKQAAVFVFLVGLVIAERANPTEKNTRRRGRQYEHLTHQGFDGGDGHYQGQEVAYENVYQHHHGSPQEVQYQNPNIDLKRYKSKEIQLPDYGYENGQTQAVPLEQFQHSGPYDFQYENQVGLQFENKGPATFNLEYVPLTPSPGPLIYPSVEAPPSPLPEGVPEKKFNIHVVPLKHVFHPDPNPFPIPERFLHKKLLLTKALPSLPPPPPPTLPPPPPPPPSHVTPVKSVGFKLNLLKPILHGSLPPPPQPLPAHAAYHQPPPPEDYFVPVPVPTVPPPPPPPPKKPPPQPAAPLKKFITFFKKFKLS